jgi:hypothetical protein
MTHADHEFETGPFKKAARESAPAPTLFDVEAVNIKTRARRKLAEAVSEDNAEAIIKTAVIRRGVDEEFFTAVPHEAAL